MIYKCSFCSKTSFETKCPWCSSSSQDDNQKTSTAQQVPLDPSFYPEFQYQTKGFFKDLLAKKKEQAQLNEILRSVLHKYSQLKKPYFVNFFHSIGHEEPDSTESSRLPGARMNGSYSNRELFREVLIRKGFTELEELPHLLDKLLLTTGFNSSYFGFSIEVSRHIGNSLLESLKSWIGEVGTRFRDDLSLFLYFLWDRKIRYPDLQHIDQAPSTYGTPLISWEILQRWLHICEKIHFDILVQRLETKLEHFDPNRFVTMYHVDAMNGYDFEKFLGEVFQSIGYDVEGTKLSGDQGADLFASRFGKKIVIQAKNYSGSVGNAAVQEAISAKGFYGCDEAMVVTNSYFTRSALELAEATSVRLIGRRELQAYLDDYNQRIIEQFRSDSLGQSDFGSSALAQDME